MKRDRGMRTFSLVACAFLIQCAVPSLEATAGDVAIVVNKANAVENLSLMDLAKLFRQEQQFWDDRRRVYLVLREAGSSEKRVVLQKVYKMDELALKKFLMAKLFAGSITSLPKTLGSNEAVKRFVSQVPTALGFIDAAVAGTDTKVVRIDGKLPGEPGYALSE